MKVFEGPWRPRDAFWESAGGRFALQRSPWEVTGAPKVPKSNIFYLNVVFIKIVDFTSQSEVFRPLRTPLGAPVGALKIGQGVPREQVGGQGALIFHFKNEVKKMIDF